MSIGNSDSSSIEHTHTAVAGIQGSLGLVSALNNIVTTVALLRTENIKPNLKICLIVLPVMDALSGIAFIYHSFALYFIYFNKQECTIRYFLMTIFSALSIMTVLTMTLERLFSAFMPLRYEIIITNTKIVVYLIFISVNAVWVSNLSFFYQNNDFQVCSYMDLASGDTFLIHGLPTNTVLLLAFIGNLALYCAARSQIKAIVPLSAIHTDSHVKSKMNLKATLTTISVVLPFLISYLPLGIFCIYMYLHPEDRTVLRSYRFLNRVFSLTIINGIINPLVYSWRLPELRMSLKRLFKRH